LAERGGEAQSLSWLEEYVFSQMAGVSLQFELDGILPGWNPDKAKESFMVAGRVFLVSLLSKRNGYSYPLERKLIRFKRIPPEGSMIIRFGMSVKTKDKCYEYDNVGADLFCRIFQVKSPV
jgi:hypothetical protein